MLASIVRARAYDRILKLARTVADLDGKLEERLTKRKDSRSDTTSRL